MKRLFLSLVLSFIGVYALAQTPPTPSDIEKQIVALEQRISELEKRMNNLLGQNERLRKVTEFGKPITEYVDQANGISHKVLSVEGDAQSGDLVVTLGIEALDQPRTIQFSETHFVNLYGEAYEVEDVEIAGQKTIRRDLEKGVPVVAKLFFRELPMDRVTEIKLLQYKDIVPYPSHKIQFKNLTVNWK